MQFLRPGAILPRPSHLANQTLRANTASRAFVVDPLSDIMVQTQARVSVGSQSDDLASAKKRMVHIKRPDVGAACAGESQLLDKAVVNEFRDCEYVCTDCGLPDSSMLLSHLNGCPATKAQCQADVKVRLARCVASCRHLRACIRVVHLRRCVHVLWGVHHHVHSS